MNGDENDCFVVDGGNSNKSSPAGFCPVHKSPCRRLVSKQGRAFFKCFKPNCHFFRWTNSSSPSSERGGSGSKRKSATDINSNSPKRTKKSEEKEPKSPRSKANVSFQLCGKDSICLQEHKSVKGALSKVLINISGLAFNEQEQEWTFPISLQETLIKKLTSEGISVSPVPQEAISAIKSVEVLDEVTDFTSLPDELMSNMFPFQIRGFTFAVQRGGRCMICDEMGLGKTIQAIAIAAHYKEDWPILVICPSSVRMNWAIEFKKWIPEIPQHQINVVMNGKEQLRSTINVVSYDLITKMQIEPGAFNFIIADESHYLKNPDTIRTRKVVPLLRRAKRAILLTGTPALSRPIELYPQIVALGCPIFPTITKFGKRYCNAFQGPYGWDFTGNSNLKELHTVLSETVMIRRLKADVLQELPEKRRQMINIEPDEACMEVLTKDMKQLKSFDGKISANDEKLEKLTADKRAIIMEMFLETAKAKVKPVISYVLDLANAGKKFLVFAHHQILLDSLEEAIARKGIRFIRIDGSTPPKKREEFVERFQQNETVLIALLSLTAAGTGITLNAADLVVFAELYWTPGILMQAEDRAHRIGQQNIVNVQFLLAKKTVDDFIWPLVEKKLFVLGKTMDGTARRMDAVKMKPGGEDSDLIQTTLDMVTTTTTTTKKSPKSSKPSPRLVQAAISPQPTVKQKNLFDFFDKDTGPFRNSDSTTTQVRNSTPSVVIPIPPEDILVEDSDSEEQEQQKKSNGISVENAVTTTGSAIPFGGEEEEEEEEEIIAEDSNPPQENENEEEEEHEEDLVDEEALTQSGMLWDPHENEEKDDDNHNGQERADEKQQEKEKIEKDDIESDQQVVLPIFAPKTPPKLKILTTTATTTPTVSTSTHSSSIFITPSNNSSNSAQSLPLTTPSKYFMEPIILPTKKPYEQQRNNITTTDEIDESQTPNFNISTSPRTTTNQQNQAKRSLPQITDFNEAKEESDDDNDDEAPSFSIGRVSTTTQFPPHSRQSPTNEISLVQRQHQQNEAETSEEGSQPNWSIGNPSKRQCKTSTTAQTTTEAAASSTTQQEQNDLAFAISLQAQFDQELAEIKK